jgi:hypothetical protein
MRAVHRRPGEHHRRSVIQAAEHEGHSQQDDKKTARWPDASHERDIYSFSHMTGNTDMR